jgi:hypothetical protein
VAAAVDVAVAARHRLPKTRNENMVLTKEELISALQNEVRILLHLASKIDRNKLDYRPTPKQRSTIELLRYLTIMGPNLIPAIKTGAFDGAAFGASQAAANAMNLDQVLAAIEKQNAFYAQELGSMSDADLRSELDMFGKKASRGSHIVFLLLGGFAAYRTQLFLYLKACGRDELNTMNLWGGADGPMQG